MQIALGKDEASDYKDGLHQVSEFVRGSGTALFFTHSDKQEVFECVFFPRCTVRCVRFG